MRTTGLLFVCCLMALASAGVHGQPVDDNQKCLECHGVKGLSSTDTLTGEFLNLTVNPSRYQHSAHGKMKCLDCHGDGYLQQPHRSSRRRDAFACLTCHAKDEVLKPTERADFKLEILRSIHAKPMGKRLDCNACHDPHVFRRVRHLAPEQRVPLSNALCLKCHGPKGAAGVFSKAQKLPDLHQWLPNRKAHHREVACVTCHGGKKGSRPHLLVEKSRTVKSCESCHTPDTGSLAAQYSSGAKAPKRTFFLSDAVWNEAYVIGATRHQVLDRISLGFFVFLVFLLCAHGLLRLMAGRNKGEDA